MGVRAAYSRPAVSAVLRLPLRLPGDRPGHRREGSRGRVSVRHDPGARRRRDLGDVSRRAVDRAVHGAGVRFHPRDRGPGAGALPDLARRDRQSAVGRGPGRAVRGDRAADRGRCSRPRCTCRPVDALVAHRHVRTVGLHRYGQPGPCSRHQLRTSKHRIDVRLHHLADHVSRWHVLRVDPAGTRDDRWVALAADPRADQPAHLHQRGHARSVHRRSAHAPVRHLSRGVRLRRPFPDDRAAQLPAPGAVLTEGPDRDAGGMSWVLRRPAYRHLVTDWTGVGRSRAELYLHMAEHELHGVSPSYEALCQAVAASETTCALLDRLPVGKRQPNLLQGAVRSLGSPVDDPATFLDFATAQWNIVAHTITTHRTQTNEPGRCATLSPLLASLPGRSPWSKSAPAPPCTCTPTGTAPGTERAWASNGSATARSCCRAR